jgi:hypothetical protein
MRQVRSSYAKAFLEDERLLYSRGLQQLRSVFAWEYCFGSG